MPRPLNVNWGEIRALASSGLSFPEISAQTGIPLSAIKNRSRRERWKIAELFGGKNANRTPPHARKALQRSTERAAHAAFASFQDKNSSSRTAIASAVQKVAQFLENLGPEDLLQRCKELEAITRSADKVFNWSDPHSFRQGAFNPELLALPPDQLAILAQQEHDRLRIQHAKPAQAQLLHTHSQHESD